MPEDRSERNYVSSSSVPGTEARDNELTIPPCHKLHIGHFHSFPLDEGQDDGLIESEYGGFIFSLTVKIPPGN